MTAGALASLPQNVPIKVCELAKCLDRPSRRMTTKRLRRWLFRLRDQHQANDVVQHVNGRWEVPSLIALEKYWPDVRREPGVDSARVEKLEEDCRRSRREVRSLRERVATLERTNERLASLVEAVVRRAEPVTIVRRTLEVDATSLLPEALGAASRSRG